MPPLAVDLNTHYSGWLAPLVEPIANWLFHGHATLEEMSFVEATLYAWFFVIPLLILLCVMGTSRRERVPGGLQNLLEAVVSGLESFSRSIIGGCFSTCPPKAPSSTSRWRRAAARTTTRFSSG